MSTERFYEQAEHTEQAMRDEGLSHIRAALQGAGCDECEDCDAPIAAARRTALPSATRCIECQEHHERGQ